MSHGKDGRHPEWRCAPFASAAALSVGSHYGVLDLGMDALDYCLVISVVLRVWERRDED